MCVCVGWGLVVVVRMVGGAPGHLTSCCRVTGGPQEGVLPGVFTKIITGQRHQE